MEGVHSSFVSQSANTAPLSAFSYGSMDATLSYKQVVIQQTLLEDSDAVSFEGSFSSSAPAIDLQKIIAKINERLKGVLPEGVESLTPEQTTSEATAERIVQGVTALFDVYSKRHPDLEGEELLAGFMDTIRSGVQQGYDDAANFLEGVGAFEVAGVKDGIEKTKLLIEEKLKAFEIKKREDLQLGQVGASVTNDLVAQVGGTLRVTA